MFEIVTVAKNDCILTDSDRGRCQRTFLRPKRHADPECNDHCRNRYTDPAFPIVEDRILGTITLLCCIIFNILAKSYWKQLSVLFGLVVGYIVAIAMGVVDFSALQGTSIIALPRLMPFKPEFNLNAIISVTLIFLVSATETIGDTSALAASGLNREASLKETSGSIACGGFISALSSVFGCLPITSFSQNVGLVAMTKVVNRFAIASGAIIMILAGIFPFFGALLATLPDAVLVCLCILRWKQGGTWYYQSLILMCIKSPIRFSLYP